MQVSNGNLSEIRSLNLIHMFRVYYLKNDRSSMIFLQIEDKIDRYDSIIIQSRRRSCITKLCIDEANLILKQVWASKTDKIVMKSSIYYYSKYIPESTSCTIIIAL